MHYITTIFLAGAALAVSVGAHAQSPPGGDMSRYESIHETPKSSRRKTATQTVPKGIQPGKNVETIGPSAGYVNPRFSGPGVSEPQQPIARGGISMKADGAVSVARAPAQSVIPSLDARARDTTVDDGKSGVINGVLRTR